MNADITFVAKDVKKILISSDFREVLISQNTSIIEQRIIFTLLTAIKDEQSKFIKVNSPINDPKNLQQSLFDDFFDGIANQGVVEFVIPIKELNSGIKMKNISIKSALINMSNINWFTLRDNSIDGFMAVPFILNPKWNRKNIFFNMDIAVVKYLLNVSQYFTVKKDFPYKVSTANSLKFLLWLLKYKKHDGVSKSYNQLLSDLSIPIRKFESRNKFERDFLINVKADLDANNDISFNYSFHKGFYRFIIYFTKHSVGSNEKFISIDELKILRSLKYLKRKRNLSETNLRFLEKLYSVRGYDEFSGLIKCKIDSHLMGDDFIKAIFHLLEKS